MHPKMKIVSPLFLVKHEIFTATLNYEKNKHDIIFKMDNYGGYKKS